MGKIFGAVVFSILTTFGLGVGLELRAKAYENFVISIADEVPAHNCRDILTNLEATLAGASQFLFSALDGRAYLRSATVLLPASWPDSCAPSPVTSGNGERSDLSVLVPDPTRGRMWTQQSLGCGQPGDQIYVSFESLKGRDDTLARTLVKEFAKYRYGVFDEQGYSNDPVYPMCYYDLNNDPRVSGCADLGTKDDSICKNPSMDYNVTSIIDHHSRTSIMFAAEAPMISMFCDEGNHNRLAPTKHNFICNRRSTLDVIINHPDFATNNDENAINNGQITDTTPKITYKKQNLTRYVLVIENSKEMLQRESWSFLRFAIRKWALYDLPDNTELGLVLTNETNSQRVLNIVPFKTASERHIGSNRDLVSSSIPYTPGDSSQAACLHCAIRDAHQMLVDRSKTHGPASDVILVIAPGMNFNSQLQSTLKDVQKMRNMRIVTINYPVIVRASPLDSLARQTGGEAFTVFEKKMNIDTSILTTYFELSNVLYSIVQKFYSGNEADLPMEIHRRKIKDDGRSSVTGSFMLDATLGEPARFMLYTHNSDSPLIRGLKIISPSHQTFSSRSETMLNVKVISVVSNISETGTWTYTVEPYAGNPQPHFLQVMATPRSSLAPAVRARFWTHRNDPHSPLILLASVTRGRNPILGAKVEVLVTKVEANGSVVYTDRFDLLDTGNGDPDIAKGDGIYTKYFSAAAGGPGLYMFEAIVSDNGNTAYSWQDAEVLNDKPCCGSVVPAPRVQPLASFQRFTPPVTIEITSDDILQASRVLVGRIGDLKADVLKEEMKVRLSWTAPDMGGQMVANYEVRYALDLQNILTERFETAAAIWETGSPFVLSPGSETTFTVDLSEYRNLWDRPLYFAVKALPHSHESQTGTVSNWVRVWVATPPPPPTIPPLHTSSDHSTWPFQINSMGSDAESSNVAKGGGFGLELILPIAIGFILLVILLILYCYFCVLRRRTRNEHKKTGSGGKNEKLPSNVTIMQSSPTHVNYSISSDIPDPHTVGVPINNYGYEEDMKKRYSLVHQQEQQLIEELKQQQQLQHQLDQSKYSGVNVISNNSLQRNGHPLSPYNSWSASQLLHEHERRHSPVQEDQYMHQELMINGSQIDQMSINGPIDNNGHHGHPEHYGHPPPVPPLPSFPSNGYQMNYNIYGVHPPPNDGHQQIYQSMQCGEHMVPYTQSSQGSLCSVNSGDKKRRNVTMV